MNMLVIGKGNLGMDLVEVMTEAGHTVKIVTASEGFDYRHYDYGPFDYVWITAGFGSVEGCVRHPNEALDTHVVMPMEVAKRLNPNTTLVCYSSDYAADESAPWSPGSINRNPRSFYAVTKITMELALRALNRKNTFVVRVGSLYGKHYPDKTFPGRLLSKYPNPCRLTLPLNRTTPTPTRWIAYVMSRNLAKLSGEFRVFHCAPVGMVPIYMWGQMILGDGYVVESGNFDNSRALCSNLQCSFEQAPDWVALWRLHWMYQQYHPPGSGQPPF